MVSPSHTSPSLLLILRANHLQLDCLLLSFPLRPHRRWLLLPFLRLAIPGLRGGARVAAALPSPSRSPPHPSRSSPSTLQPPPPTPLLSHLVHSLPPTSSPPSLPPHPPPPTRFPAVRSTPPFVLPASRLLQRGSAHPASTRPRPLTRRASGDYSTSPDSPFLQPCVPVYYSVHISINIYARSCVQEAMRHTLRRHTSLQPQLSCSFHLA